MSARKAQKIRDIILLIGAIITLLGHNSILTVAGVIIMFSCLIPDFLFNKCPHCKRRLGRNAAKFCQFCGKAID